LIRVSKYIICHFNYVSLWNLHSLSTKYYVSFQCSCNNRINITKLSWHVDIKLPRHKSLTNINIFWDLLRLTTTITTTTFKTLGLIVQTCWDQNLTLSLRCCLMAISLKSLASKSVCNCVSFTVCRSFLIRPDNKW
jgi:hypothetical protein